MKTFPFHHASFPIGNYLFPPIWMLGCLAKLLFPPFSIGAPTGNEPFIGLRGRFEMGNEAGDSNRRAFAGGNEIFPERAWTRRLGEVMRALGNGAGGWGTLLEN